LAREVASRTISKEMNHRERNLQVVQLAKAIAEGNVKMTLADLDKLIRLEAFLSDEPDSRQEIVIGDLRGKSTEELREMMREEIQVLKELEERGCES
jgi:hypothetical protein